MSSPGIRRALKALACASVLAAGTAVAQTFEVVHSFVPANGADPQSGIVQLDNGDFAGTTVGGLGTLFKMDAQGRLGTMYLFKGRDDGAAPHAPLVLDREGNLFGTTMSGLAGWGGIYKLDPSGQLTVLKSFVPSDKGPEGEGGVPHAPLLASSSGLASTTWFGVTTRGGKDDLGTIFTMDAAYAVRTIRHFSGTDGALPFESLTELNGRIYGVTSFGGALNAGTIFRMDADGGNFAVLHEFGANDGIRPESPLVVVNGALYGTTAEGGRFGKGTVFRLDPSGRGYSVLHSFNGFDGARPHAALVKASDGYLYGTTSEGAGLNFHTDAGTLFKMSWNGGDFSTIHRFTRMDGAAAQARMIEATDGALYGTTSRGGAEDLGVVFRLVFVPVREIVPTSGPAAGGTSVSLFGENFRPGADLTFAGRNAGGVVLSDGSLNAVTPALEPGSLNDVLVENLDRTRGGILKGFFADFLDVPQADIFHRFVESIVRNRITAGVGEGRYGRNIPATNAQMAVFLLRAKYGPFYVPPPATGTVFGDVPADHRFASWIEQLYREGITDGCVEGALFCPDESVTRERMAMLLLRAKYGPAHVPPPCKGIFADVPCYSFAEYPYAPWIEQLYNEGITGGCNGGRFFCPGDAATRGQTATFLVKTFNLP